MNTDRRICILTYQTVHRKTLDTIFRLKANGYTNVCVYAKPFHYIKKYVPLVAHRPEIGMSDTLNQVGYSEIIKNFGYELRNISAYEEIREAESAIFLICGAGLIPEEITHKYRIVNAHPGYIPMVRGLDALKWAVIEGLPIGVTTHVLGDYVDAGDIIERKEIPVFENDTFHLVAYRQYEMEVEMLVRAVELADQIAFVTDGENYSVHRRMPHELEKRIYEKFERYKLRILKHDKNRLSDGVGGGRKAVIFVLHQMLSSGREVA